MCGIVFRICLHCFQDEDVWNEEDEWRMKEKKKKMMMMMNKHSWMQFFVSVDETAPEHFSVKNVKKKMKRKLMMMMMMIERWKEKRVNLWAEQHLFLVLRQTQK